MSDYPPYPPPPGPPQGEPPQQPYPQQPYPPQPVWSPMPGPPGPSNGPGAGLIVVIVLLLLALAAGSTLITLAVIGGNDSDTSATDDITDTPTEEPSSDTPDTEEPVPVEPSTVNPPPPSVGSLTLGARAEVGDFTLTLRTVDSNANKEIEQINQFNDPPAGRYVLASWTATYHGSGKGDTSFDIRTSAIGADGKEYLDYDCGAVVSDNTLSAPPLKSGQSRTFDTCFDVPIKEIHGFTVAAKPALGDGPPAVWTP